MIMSMFKLIKLFFKLPGPKDLGYKYNVLPMRKITPNLLKEEYTWEDHYEYLKKRAK